MASLNTSSEGASISRSYKAIADAPAPSGAAASSPTYGQWALFQVSAPLASAFADSGKESVLKVQSTGEGELSELIEDFSDGRIQFAFVKVQDPNTTLRKGVLIGWCGEGVPERTKGYFTSHLAAVAKILQGYHVQVTARAESDVTPEGIIKKVADSSGSKYAGDTGAAPSSRPAPPVASKPVFTPSRVAGASTSFAPVTSRSRQAQTASTSGGDDGWGDEAQSSRQTLEKVQPAYKPTKVDMASLTSQKQESRFQAPTPQSAPDVVRGAYQPIGKVDIAAIRRQAKAYDAGSDRPTTVKGAYEPVGKVDIAAIRAKAQPPSGSGGGAAASTVSPAATGTSGQDEQESPSLAQRSSAFTAAGNDSGRLTSLPKPQVSNKFGANTSSFAGTKAPAPGGFEAKAAPSAAAPIGAASRTFADQGGKTPAQIWAEKKAQQGGSTSVETSRGAAPVASQPSGGAGGAAAGAGGWQSGYTGKKWGEVQLPSRTGASGVSNDKTGDEAAEQEPVPSGGVGSIRDRFKDAAPIGVARDAESAAPPPPPMDLSSKPNTGGPRGVPIPGMGAAREDDVPAEQHHDLPPPPAQPRSPTPESPELRPSSPIRIAQPVSSSKPLEPAGDEEEQPPIPIRSVAEAAPEEHELEDEEPVSQHDPARAAGQAAAAATFGAGAVAASSTVAARGKRARAEYEYEKAEDNELAMAEGEVISNIDMVDSDWWMGENERGETGLFPMNYVTLLDDDDDDDDGDVGGQAAASGRAVPEPAETAAPSAAAGAGASAKEGATATAEYDYEAAEENELSFPEGAKITGVEFPDEDWWFGHYNGKQGLFPANYTKLDQ